MTRWDHPRRAYAVAATFLSVFVILPVILAVHFSAAASSVVSACVPSASICQGTPTTITAVEIIAGTPVQILPAQGANTTIVVVAVNLQYIPGTMAFSQDYVLDVDVSGVNAFNCTNIGVQTSMTNAQLSAGTCVASSNAGYAANSAVFALNDNGPAIGGNGSIVVTPLYSVVRVQ